jgi:N-acylneuraminate cytidylyltransferase
MDINNSQLKKIGIIPVRKGSKSIKNKNKKKLLGRPLFTWELWEAFKSKLDYVYVFTDDNEIINFVESEYKSNKKIKVIKRSVESATDEASTEVALHEFTQKINKDYDILCLLQATSPLTTAQDINNVLDKLIQYNYDSILTVVQSKRFFWDKNGMPLNYDYNNRPRRQDFDGLLVENGAIYATTKKQFEKSGVRIGGKIGVVEMPEDTFTELDESVDWLILENLLEERLRKNKQFSKEIKAIFIDVDGILTPGTVYVSGSGEFAKEFSMRDGMGFEILRLENIPVFVITGENSDIVKRRMEKLKVSSYYLNVQDKFAKVDAILLDKAIKWSEIAYVGDDINDLACLLAAGWSFCPVDAMKEVKNYVDLVLHNKGGEEAVREVIDFIINFNKRGY